MSFESVIAKTKKLFILGGYGSGNYGDEAILAGILETVKKINPSINCEAVAFNPKELKKLHGIEGRTIVDFVSRFYDYDTLLIGGGTIFRPNMRLRAQLVPLVGMVLKIFGKRLVFYSLGIDKKTSWLAKRLLVPAMNIADFVSVRDTTSMKVLKSWGVKNKIHLVQDPAIDLGYEKPTASTLKNLGINPKKKLVGVSLRYLKAEKDLKFLPELAKLLKELISKGYQVVYFPFCRSPFSKFEDDYYVGAELRKLVNSKDFVILNKPLPPKELKGLVARMNYFIGMRLHSMIFSVSTKTPIIGLCYAQKCYSYLKANKKQTFDLENIDFANIRKLILKKR